MPRKRNKEVTPEPIEQDNAPAPTPEPTPPPAASVTAATPTESEGSTTQAEAREPGEQQEAAADAGEQPVQKKWAYNGPTLNITAPMSNERGGPVMRFGRDYKFHQLVIKFDIKPLAPEDDPEGKNKYIETLRREGYQWRGKEGYWTKQLSYEREHSEHVAGEEFFFDLARQYQRDHNVSQGQKHGGPGM